MVVPSNMGLSGPANRILLVLGQTPFPVELLDAQCRVLYCNRAYSQSFLGPTDAVLDRPSRIFPEVFAGGLGRGEVLDRALGEGLWKGETEVEGAAGTLAVRIIVFPIHHPSDSFGEFAVYYEDIGVELAARRELALQQKLVAIRSRQAQMGELLSLIAHQWRQPLTVVSSLVGNIQLKAQLGALEPEYLRAKLDRVNENIQFLSETIDSFRNFYLPAKSRVVEDLVALARRALVLLEPTFQNVKARIETSFPTQPVKGLVFTGEFLQLYMELLANARDALLASPPVDPVVRFSVSQEEGQVVVRLANNGGEIPEDVRPSIYEPYYTTKEGTSGTGLGLYMARIIVENHHGGSLVAVCSDGWTEFVCRLPLEASHG